MSTLTYLTLLAFVFALAAVLDRLWLDHVRPLFAASRGWPDVRACERIPTVAWIGGFVFVAIIFIFVARVGTAVGF